MARVRPTTLALTTLAALAVLPISASAGPLFQPNNTPIPQGPSLQVNGFDALGDPVNAINDAEVTPETKARAIES